MNMKIPFKIEHLDPLGQGVSKIGDKVTFIPKTLPGEEGEAIIWREAKGVRFAIADNIANKSDDRIIPECPHYEQCNGCSFLHTSYPKELEFKEKTFTHFFKKCPTIHQAPKRLGYRNRIQLHFLGNKIGYIDPSTRQITEVPGCLLPTDEIRQELSALYQLHSYRTKKGHLEIYRLPTGQLKTTYNKSYAYGGFSQVNEAQNSVLQKLVAKHIHKKTSVLELFGGNGNLTHKSNYGQRWIIDQYPKEPKEPFFSQDLFRADALQKVSRVVPRNIDLLILDPPRQGLKMLSQFANHFQPETIIYVSCNLQTQMRDLTSILNNYTIEEYHLIDLFPSTAHFETLIQLKKS